jgi:hypothetical protein
MAKVEIEIPIFLLYTGEDAYRVGQTWLEMAPHCLNRQAVNILVENNEVQSREDYFRRVLP